MTKMVDVARHAGVSVKTVSRVLNNEPHVQDALRARVRESVAELGYVPSASARSLRSSRSYSITLVSHTLNSAFVHAIQFGALQVCHEAGYRLNVTMLNPLEVSGRDELLHWCQTLMKSGKPDGVILVPPLSNDPVISDVISRYGISIVRIGPNDISDENATVMIDDRAAARDATKYLINLGHRRIGFVRGKEDQDATPKRYMGYCDALGAAGLDIDDALIRPGQFDFETGLAAGRYFLEMDTPPTAVFASNDDMAAGVLVAAHQHGIAVPGRLSIIGFDDSEIAAKMWPALTTIGQPLQEFGARAMEVMIAMTGKGPDVAEDGLLPYKMVERDTTGPVPI